MTVSYGKTGPILTCISVRVRVDCSAIVDAALATSTSAKQSVFYHRAVVDRVVVASRILISWCRLKVFSFFPNFLFILYFYFFLPPLFQVIIPMVIFKWCKHGTLSRTSCPSPCTPYTFSLPLLSCSLPWIFTVFNYKTRSNSPAW